MDAAQELIIMTKLAGRFAFLTQSGPRDIKGLALQAEAERDRLLSDVADAPVDLRNTDKSNARQKADDLSTQKTNLGDLYSSITKKESPSLRNESKFEQKRIKQEAADPKHNFSGRMKRLDDYKHNKGEFSNKKEKSPLQKLTK